MSLENYQYTSPDVERSSILENYSEQLSRRDEALDRRESVLKKREQELQASLERCKQQEREMELQRTSIYEERALFQRKTSERKSYLDQMEGDQKAAVDDLNGRVAIVNDLLQTSKKTAGELREKREELRKVNETLAHMHGTLRNAQKTVAELRAKSEQATVRERKCAQIVISLDSRQTELNALHDKLTAMQEELVRREKVASQRENEVHHILPLKRILPALRQAAQDYAEFRSRMMCEEEEEAQGRHVIQVPRDAEEEFAVLREFIQEIRAHARALESRESACVKRDEAVAQRERSVASLESALLAREKTLKESERMLGIRGKEVEAQFKEAKVLAENGEENSKRVQKQEERLDQREVACRETELLLKEKEAHIGRQRRLLVAQERSLKRAGDAVKSHEAAVANEALKITESKLRLEGLDEDLRAREALLKTKEIELSFREARQQHKDGSRGRRNRTQNTSNEQVLGDSDGFSGNTRVSQMAASSSEKDSTSVDVEPVRKSRHRRDREAVPPSRLETAGQGVEEMGNMESGSNVAVKNDAPRPPVVTEISEPTDKEVTAPAVAGTVRKQLTFTPSAIVSQAQNPRTRSTVDTAVPTDNAVFTSTNNPRVRPSVIPAPTAVVADSGDSEDSSEIAAGQLHGELNAARAVWIEKVNRLDKVVSSMSVDLTTTGKQLLPVIRNVRSELNRIRYEALSEPENKRSPASTAFASERELHRNWAKSMSTQLNTIKEVQAGLLHAFNRVLPNSSPGDAFFETDTTHVIRAQSVPLQPLQLQETRSDSTSKSKSRGESAATTQATEALLKALTPAKPERKARKLSKKNAASASSSELSITENSKLPQYTLAVPTWHDMRPIAQAPRSTSTELAALRRELGLDQ